MMIAIATAASAAAIATIKSINIYPCNMFGYKYLLNTTKFMHTAFNINSVDIRIVIRFLRTKNPYTPMKNINVLTIKKCCIGIPSIIISVFYFFAIIIAATIAASNKIEITSNGRTYP